MRMITIFAFGGLTAEAFLAFSVTAGAVLNLLCVALDTDVFRQPSAEELSGRARRPALVRVHQ
jgi:hypothetical protein